MCNYNIIYINIFLSINIIIISELKNLASTIFSSISTELTELQKSVEIQNKEFGIKLEEINRDSCDRDSKLSSK